MPTALRKVLPLALALALVGCTGPAEEPSPEPTVEAGPHPWEGAFAGTLTGDPEIVSYAGVERPRVSTREEDDEILIFFGDPDGVASGQPVIGEIEFSIVYPGGGLAAWLGVGDLVGYRDGTARTDTSSESWEGCSADAQPPVQEAQQVVTDAEGRVVSFEVYVYDFNDLSDEEGVCDQYILGRYLAAFERVG